MFYVLTHYYTETIQTLQCSAPAVLYCTPALVLLFTLMMNFNEDNVGNVQRFEHHQ